MNPMAEARGLYLRSTSTQYLCRYCFGFIARYIWEGSPSTGQHDKLPVLNQNLPNKERFHLCTVLPCVTLQEPINTPAGG